MATKLNFLQYTYRIRINQETVYSQTFPGPHFGSWTINFITHYSLLARSLARPPAHPPSSLHREEIGEISHANSSSCLLSTLNLLTPGRWGCNLESMTFKLVIQNSSMGTDYEIVLRWMPQVPTNEKSTLVQVIAWCWCHQATNHCLSRCWPRSLLPYGITSMLGHNVLTHWGRATHICVGKLTIIGSDNGLSPGRRQAIIWTIAGILLIGSLGTNLGNFNRNSNIFIQENAFENVVCKMASICLGLNVLKNQTSTHKDLTLDITVPANVLSPDSSNPSADTALAMVVHFLKSAINDFIYIFTDLKISFKMVEG